MGTLFIDRKDTHLEVDAGLLRLRDAEGTLAQQVPLVLLERVVVRAQTHLSSAGIAALAEAGVGLLVLAGRRGERVCCLLGAPREDMSRRVAQVRALDDSGFVLAWSRRLVLGKLRAQRRLLRGLMERRPDLRKPLFDALGTLDQLPSRAAYAGTLDVLRGIEGAGAAAYFRALGAVVPEAFGFSGRRRRPPRDGINAMLSLGYTLLYGQAVHAAHAAGLDPAIGYLHASDGRRAAFACDLMEPLRPRVDRMVLELVRERLITPEHFGQDGSSACLLGKAGRRHFYAAWADRVSAIRSAMRRQVMLGASALRARGRT